MGKAKKSLTIIVIWLVAISAIAGWFIFREKYTVKDFTAWALSVAPLLTLILAGGGALTLIVINLDHKKKDKQTSVFSDIKRETIKFRENQIDKRTIPDKLLEMNNYLVGKISEQKVSAEKLVPVAKKWLKWYDYLKLFWLLIIYINPLAKRFMQKSLFNNVLIYSASFNALLREEGLGTLPIVENDNGYLVLFKEIIALENGLPPSLCGKIHRCINLSSSLNCWRILSPEKDFHKELTPNKYVAPTFNLVENNLSVLLSPLDVGFVQLRGEISQELEKYFTASDVE